MSASPRCCMKGSCSPCSPSSRPWMIRCEAPYPRSGALSQVRDPTDLVRDVIKADSAAVLVPELDMELGIGTLGGLVTTVEVRSAC